MAFLSPQDMLLIGIYVTLSTCAASAATSILIQYWRGRVDTWAPTYQCPWAHNPVVILAIWVTMLIATHMILPIVIIFAMYCLVRFLSGATNVGWVQLRPRLDIVSDRQRRRRESDEQARREREDAEGQYVRDEDRPSVVQELQEYAASFGRPPRYTSEESPPPAFTHEELRPMRNLEEAAATFIRQGAPPAYLSTIWEESGDEISRPGSKAEDAEELGAAVTRPRRPEPAMLRRVVADRQ